MKQIESHDKLEGLFLVNFKDKDFLKGMNIGNDPKPAIIIPYKGSIKRQIGRLDITWLHDRWSGIFPPEVVNVYKLENNEERNM